MAGVTSWLCQLDQYYIPSAHPSDIVYAQHFGRLRLGQSSSPSVVVDRSVFVLVDNLQDSLENFKRVDFLKTCSTFRRAMSDRNCSQ
jgi:hypothetical protein